jgi:hypothetical protein
MERKKEEVKCPRSLAASAVNTNATQKKRKEKQKKKNMLY